jgi:putative oxidoreductase
MNGLTAYAAPLGRLLLALVFIKSGVGKLGNPEGVAAYIEQGGLPGVLVWAVIALEIGGGVMIVLGYRARVAALLLAGFCVATGVLFHLLPGLQGDPAALQGQLNNFYKNLALAGAFLMIVASGPGPYSMSPRREMV